MARFALLVLLLSMAGHLAPPAARACGGLFCGVQPIDQGGERIVFRINDDSVTMAVQINYSGAARDFAWVLPLAELPDVDSLAVLPPSALFVLDLVTAPQFLPARSCPMRVAASASGGDSVNVHFRAEVGPYDVAGISSDDPAALYDWLRGNAFNVNASMLPYIEAYTEEGLKFLALKLRQNSDTGDIQPFRFEFPGSVPTIPLRMTALAAEPEMSLVVWVFGEQRYAGANWPAVEIRDEQLAWTYPIVSGQGSPRFTFPVRSNWSALVARGVDEAGGQGWVTEFAGLTQRLIEQLAALRNGPSPFGEAAEPLLDLIGGAPYVTRLYSRLSAEEMSSDPVFRKDAGGDVSAQHMLTSAEGQDDRCPFESNPAVTGPASIDPCLFTSCGAGGICRPVQLEQDEPPVPGCVCVEGAVARTTIDVAPVVLRGADPRPAVTVCQDARLSFVNPGDTTASGEVMADPCQQFDCGTNGTCLAVNMTPTCVCDRGFVAVGSLGSAGARTTRCEQPLVPVPEEFYAQRLPDLPKDLPGGRAMDVDGDMPVVQPRMDDLGSTAMPRLATSDHCAVRAPGTAGGIGLGLPLGLSLIVLALRRRSS